MNFTDISIAVLLCLSAALMGYSAFSIRDNNPTTLIGAAIAVVQLTAAARLVFF